MAETKRIEKKKKSKKIKKILRWLLLVLLLVILWEIFPTFFYGPEKNGNPLQPFYKKGVYHMHSIFSDGKGTVDDIAAAARELGLDFAIITDHGRPNVPCSDATRYRNGVLLLGGSELSLTSGHLAALGYKTPDYIFPPEPQEAIDEMVKDNNAVCFVSHPFDTRINWTDWNIEAYTGLEVLSSYTEARRAGVWKVLVFPMKYWINSRYALLDTMNYPERNTGQWDLLNSRANRKDRYLGIYALDAHAKLPITKKFSLGFPTYKSMFQIMTVYIRLENGLNPDAEKAEADVVEALKAGKFFNVIEGIAPANGFDAWFKEKESGNRIEMGGVSAAKAGTLVLETPFEYETEIRLIKNGKVSERIANNSNKQVKIEINGGGVYRVEVYVPSNTFDDLPWIMTNPFFLAMPPPPIDDRRLKELAITARLPLPNEEKGLAFSLEKNGGSAATIEYKQGVIQFTFDLKRDTPGSRDFWSVMSLRKPLDLFTYNGFVINMRSSKTLRYWIEFRTEKTWYRHSFLARSEWNKKLIRFENFHPYHGEREKPDLSRVNSIFIGINNQSAYEGTAAVLSIKELGLY